MTPHRATDPYDWPALLSLIRRAFAGMEGRIDPPSSMLRLTPEAIARQAVEGEVWVIGPPTACVFLTVKPHGLYIGKLAVDPAAQGKGFGRALVALAETRAHALGLSTLTLETRVELVENHALFQRLGFTEVARTAHPGYGRPTSIRYDKLLTR